VIDGFSVVKAVETVGSMSGSTAHRVIIAECGMDSAFAQAKIKVQP